MTLHIYSQSFYHEDCYIVGTSDDLKNLGEALIKASQSGMAAIESYTADGEGYSVKVANLCDLEMDYLKLPYTDEIAKDSRKNAMSPFQIFYPGGN